MDQRIGIVVVIPALGWMGAGSVSASGPVLAPIVLTSDSPGFGPGIAFNHLSSPTVNNSGQMVFTASLMGAGVDSTNDRAAYFFDGAGLMPLLREGTSFAAESGPGLVDQLVNEPLLNDAGTYAFEARFNAGDHLILSGDTGGIDFTTWQGQSVPGRPGVTLGYVGPAGLDDAGRIVAGSFLEGAPFDPAVAYRATPSTFAPFAEEDEALSPPLQDWTISSLDARFGSINSYGDFVRPMSLRNDTGSITEFRNTLFVERDGSRAFLHEGTAAPGTGGTFFWFEDEKINDNGEVAFVGRLEPGIDAGIWAGPIDDLTPVALTSDVAVPGSGIPTFQSFGPLLWNSAGHLTFSADSAIHQWQGGVIETIAGIGQQAPGLAGGVTFGQFAFASNASGLVVFESYLSGTGIGSDNNQSLWVWDGAGDPSLLLQEGQALEIEGETRILSSIGARMYSSGEDGRSRGLTDDGRLGLYLRFTDGTRGIFMMQIPAPATFVIASAAIGVSLRRRRPR